jgi:16S rRNA (guanine966-N2)-methyltransferase
MHGLRISGGSLRGRKLRVDPKAGVRPTSERARQAYFNIVADRIPGARFLDLYAGSGIFSFEAVSRGASEAVALDLSRKTVAAIVASSREWGVDVRAETARLPEALSRLASTSPFDLVYADPPYNLADYGKLLESISAAVPLSEEALVAVEHRSGDRAGIPEESGRLRLLRTSRYGNVSISFFDLREPNGHE